MEEELLTTEEDPGQAQELSAPEEDASRQETEAVERYAPHFRELERQGEALGRAIPGFDLRQELRNPVFARLTAPGTGVSVEDAFFAVHRRELQEAAMRSSARQTAEKLVRSIQAGNLRPRENGVMGRGPSVAGFDYRSASKEQREALKRRIREAGARGEKVYPR